MFNEGADSVDSVLFINANANHVFIMGHAQLR